MSNKDQENVDLVEELEKKEAGVKELFDFYAGVETVYAASIRALGEENTSTVSSSANNE
jgi:hypothetical protein